MSKKRRIEKIILDLKPYIIAHRINYAGLFKINKTEYKRIIKNLATAKIEYEKDEYMTDLNNQIFARYFSKDTKKSTVRELALSFQGYVDNVYCHSCFRKSPQHQPLDSLLLEAPND